jgi:hypothetical protein
LLTFKTSPLTTDAKSGSFPPDIGHEAVVELSMERTIADIFPHRNGRAGARASLSKTTAALKWGGGGHGSGT